MKPVVGVLPSIGIERDRLYILKAYMTAIRDTGGLPVLLFPETESGKVGELLDLCDGVLFTGGEDISPYWYGEDNSEGWSFCCEERDYSEQAYLSEAMSRKMPVFGICRGFQSINVLLGGTLYQDLDRFHPSFVEHQQPRSNPGTSHQVMIQKGSGLYQLFGQETVEVNSFHHQGVRELAKGLVCSARAEDGLCEAYEMPDYPFLWAVQWHPERNFGTNEPSRLLIQRFLTAVTDYAETKQ